MTSCLKSWSYRFIHRKCICQRTISNYYNSSSIPSSDQGWKRGNVLSRLHNLSCPWIYRSYSLSSTLLIFKRRSTSLFVREIRVHRLSKCSRSRQIERCVYNNAFFDRFNFFLWIFMIFIHLCVFKSIFLYNLCKTYI